MDMKQRKLTPSSIGKMPGVDKEPEKNLHSIKQEMDHEIYNGLLSKGTKRRISDQCEDPAHNVKLALPIINMNKYELAAEDIVDPIARSAGGSSVKQDEQSPMVMVAGHVSPTPQVDDQLTFLELVGRMDMLNLAEMHVEKVKALMIYDPKRKDEVPSRFCSFHLANFDLDAMSEVLLGPPYEPAECNKMAASSINVISVRVVKAGSGFPVEVYGKIIARDEVDYKCVSLFDRERDDAQLINSEQDVLALTGPCQALVTMGLLFFEFDLKIKGKGEPDEDAQFSKGVIPYYHNPYNKRIIEQLPSFESTVKLVLQHVASPVAASVKVNVVRKHPGDATVHFDGKITVGTSRNYRQHMVVYDSSLPSPRRALVRENGSLVLNRNLLAVQGPVYDTAFKEEEQMTLHVCFLDAGSEIEDEDYTSPEEEDYVSPDEYDVDDDDDIRLDDEQEGQEECDEEEDHKNFVTLKYPLMSKAVWENLSHKLEVEVEWSAIPPARFDAEFITRLALLPKGYKSPNYRWGPFFE